MARLVISIRWDACKNPIDHCGCGEYINRPILQWIAKELLWGLKEMMPFAKDA
jgi:hypothetical protein